MVAVAVAVRRVPLVRLARPEPVQARLVPLAQALKPVPLVRLARVPEWSLQEWA